MTFVRVRLDNGFEASMSEAYVSGTEGFELLDVPATNLRGQPLPATRKDGRRIKPRTTVDQAVATRAAAANWLTRKVAQATSTPTGGDAEQEVTPA